MLCVDGFHECDGCGRCTAKIEYCAECGAFIGEDYDIYENENGDIICAYCHERNEENEWKDDF